MGSKLLLSEVGSKLLVSWLGGGSGVRCKQPKAVVTLRDFIGQLTPCAMWLFVSYYDDAT